MTTPIHKEITRLKEKQEKLQQEIRDMKSIEKKKNLEKKIEKAQEMLKEKISENNKLRGELTQIQSQITELDKQYQEKSEEKKSNNNSNNESNINIRNKMESNINQETIEQKIQNNCDKIERLEKKISKLETEKIKLVKQDLKENLQQKLDEEKKVLKEKINFNNQLRNQIQDIDNQIQEILKMNEDLKGQEISKDPKDQELEGLKNEIETCEEEHTKLTTNKHKLLQEKESLNRGEQFEKKLMELKKHIHLNNKLRKEIEEIKLLLATDISMTDERSESLYTVTENDLSDFSDPEDFDPSLLDGPRKHRKYSSHSTSTNLKSNQFRNQEDEDLRMAFLHELDSTKTNSDQSQIENEIKNTQEEQIQNSNQENQHSNSHSHSNSNQDNLNLNQNIEKEQKEQQQISGITINLIEKQLNKSEIETIEEIFKLPQAIDYFKEFLCQQLTQENIMFYLDVNDFKNLKNPKAISRTANAIFEKYVKTEAIFEINIDFRSRMEIIEMVERQEFNLNMFDKAQNIIFTLMEHNSFEPFKQSPLYKELIEKLSAGGTYNIFSSIKTASLLLEILIDLLNSHFSFTTSDINCQLISRSIPFRRFVQQTTKLQKIKLKGLNHSQLFTFFMNIYNILAIHSIIIRGISISRGELKKFHKNSQYIIDNCVYSLDDIRNGVLRENKDKPSRLGNKYFKGNDKRSKYTLSSFDPRIHFLLINFDSNQVPLRVFYLDSFYQELAHSTSLFLNQNVKIYVKKKRVLLPRVFRDYQKDFKPTQSRMLLWIADFLKPAKAKKILDNPNSFSIKYLKRSSTPFIVFDNKYTSISNTDEK
ncbi:electron carrier/ protein disulfide oxidoreductase [Anaeramoeba ignava]|uniref:Electron carrier/ protein disulfide oxidoreductase n=1 Tax=Anaeramoeba ignava TaxID=1746090 RepID=A0A9Q0LG47_ANAIG|nr:electron carrier/ protein disulfide oxidoreductase [Anaeramoeba ignava]